MPLLENQSRMMLVEVAVASRESPEGRIPAHHRQVGKQKAKKIVPKGEGLEMFVDIP